MATSQKKKAADTGGNAPAVGTPSGAKRPRSRLYRRKDDIVLEAAEKAFLEAGFAKTSMDGVAELAQVSKRTIYSNFANKEALFAAVIRKRCDEVLPGALDNLDLATADLEGLLTDLGTKFLRSIYSTPQINLYQTVVAASRRFPSVGKMMYDGPIAQSRDIFEHVLRAEMEMGRLNISDPHIAATQLVALLKTDLHMGLLFEQPVAVDEKHIAEISASCVHLFLYGAAGQALRKEAGKAG
ncbi:MAG TPA: TetR/AcrR family transcriptional regulator [Sphingobium sp.]